MGERHNGTYPLFSFGYNNQSCARRDIDGVKDCDKVRAGTSVFRSYYNLIRIICHDF
jgi:hypothetical protein